MYSKYNSLYPWKINNAYLTSNLEHPLINEQFTSVGQLGLYSKHTVYTSLTECVLSSGFSYEKQAMNRALAAV